MAINSVGGYAGMQYPTEYKTRNTDKGAGTFEQQVGKAAPRGDVLTLHGECEEGERRVTAWADNVSKTSMSVYEPKGFDPKNPIYKVKVWDPDGNMTEHMVDISKIDPNNCSTIEMYAYSAHLSGTGECPDALTKFMMAHAHQRDAGGGDSYEDMFKNVDWVSVIKDAMAMQYRIGNMEGYLGYKTFLEALEKK